MRQQTLEDQHGLGERSGNLDDSQPAEKSLSARLRKKAEGLISAFQP